MIIVCGGGPAGCAAAISAARLGGPVTLIERYGFLGGMGTLALVQPWMGYYNGKTKVIGGVFDEIVNNLKKYNGFKESEHFGNIHYCFDQEILKYILQEMCLKEKIKILFHSFITGVKKDGLAIRSVHVESKEGGELLEADVFIDCTGDADIAHLSGFLCEKGRKSDGLTQPVTLNFRIDNVDTAKMPEREEINKKYIKAKNKGLINNPRENVLWFDTPHKNSVHFNTTRVNKIDGTKRDDLTMAEIEGHRQMIEVFEFLRQNIPGFENSYIAVSGPAIGIRETRRIIGDYVLTEEDILSGAKFDDAVASGCYAVDIHNPEGEGTVIKKLKPETYYNIPYKCLLPQKSENLIVAGRPISATHEAHSSVRIQPTCYATGQAAGSAAFMAWKENKKFREIDIEKLKNILLNNGVIL